MNSHMNTLNFDENCFKLFKQDEQRSTKPVEFNFDKFYNSEEVDYESGYLDLMLKLRSLEEGAEEEIIENKSDEPRVEHANEEPDTVEEDATVGTQILSDVCDIDLS